MAPSSGNAPQWPCTGGTNQKWHRYSSTDLPVGEYSYVNVHSGKCLEIADWSQQAGAPARLWTCDYGADQNFGITATDW